MCIQGFVGRFAQLQTYTLANIHDLRTSDLTDASSMRLHDKAIAALVAIIVSVGPTHLA